MKVDIQICKASLLVFLVETSDICSPSSTLEVSATRGSISSAVARKSGCGSMNIPWTITLKEGQKVSVKLIDFLADQNTNIKDTNSKCKPIG